MAAVSDTQNNDEKKRKPDTLITTEQTTNEKIVDITQQKEWKCQSYFSHGGILAKITWRSRKKVS